MGATDSSIPVPDTSACRAAHDWIFANTPPFVANHSLRSYRFARLLAPELQVDAADYDPEVLFLACVLHDVGLTDHANGTQRFEVDGADFARQFVLDAGIHETRADVIWQAIALHTTGSIASRMGPEIALANAGISADILGRHHHRLRESQVADAHAGLPRLDLGNALVAAALHQISACSSKAPPFTFPGDLAAHRGLVSHPSFEELLEANPWCSRP